MRPNKAATKLDQFESEASLSSFPEFIKKRFPSNPEMGLKFPSWLAALIGIVAIKAVLSLAVKPGSLFLSFGGIGNLLLLILATGFAVRNAIQRTHTGSRLFWTFLAIAYGLWGLDYCFGLYSQLVLRAQDSDNWMADSLLFLHIVPLMAAVAAVPHKNIADSKRHRVLFTALFLLFCWTVLSGYTIFPPRYSTSSYGLRFDILYLIENMALVLALGYVTLRARGDWRSTYLHLLGASSLYAVSSAVANLAMDSGAYVNGKLYELGVAASLCWFVWIPLRIRKVPEAGLGARPSDGDHGSRTSVWAMLAVVMISIPVGWELFARNENVGARTVRLLVAIATIAGLASLGYMKEYLAKRDLTFHFGLARDRLRLAMQSSASVGWDLDLESGRDVWFGDLQTIFGIPSNRHDTTADEFMLYVHPDDRQRVSDALAAARHNHTPYAEEFRIIRRPDGTIRWLAARGKFYFSTNGCAERMVGISMDITERKLAEERVREYEKAVEGSEEMIAVVDREYRFLIANRKFLRMRNMTREQVIGRYAHEVLNPGVFQEVKPKLDESFQGKVVRFEMKYTYPEVGQRDVLISYFPIEGPTGVDRVASIVQDVTDRKRLEKVLTGMSRKLIEAQEQERARIARELHDDINQRLALLAVEVEQVQLHLSALPLEVRNRMRALQKHTAQISSDLDTMACELHSPNLEYLGILDALRNLCRDFAVQHMVKIDFTHDDIPQPVSHEVTLCLFRILQEALRNAARHSSVRHFEVKLGYTSNELHLVVTDQGIGFDTDAAMIKGGLGLLSMRERVRLVHGTIEIESKLMDGTTVRVRVPVGSDRDRADHGPTNRFLQTGD